MPQLNEMTAAKLEAMISFNRSFVEMWKTMNETTMAREFQKLVDTYARELERRKSEGWDDPNR